MNRILTGGIKGVRRKYFGIANILRLVWKDYDGNTLSCKENKVKKFFFSLAGVWVLC